MEMDDSIPEEQLVFHNKIRQFVAEELEPISLKVDKDGRIPDEIVSKMRELGLFGLSIPREFLKT